MNKNAFDRLILFEDASSRIGVSIECLMIAQPGTPYSLIIRKLSRAEIQKVFDGISYLKEVYDIKSMESLKKNLQISLWEKDGVKWKSRKVKAK